MKTRYEKILVPFDFDENAVSTLAHAGAMARDSGAKLFVLHVVPEDELHSSRAVYEPKKTGGPDPHRARAIAQEKLAAIVHEHVPPEVTVVAEARVGKPADVVVAVEAEFGGDLVVMHGDGAQGARQRDRVGTAGLLVPGARALRREMAPDSQLPIPTSDNRSALLCDPGKTIRNRPTVSDPGSVLRAGEEVASRERDTRETRGAARPSNVWPIPAPLHEREDRVRHRGRLSGGRERRLSCVP